MKDDLSTSVIYTGAIYLCYEGANQSFASLSRWLYLDFIDKKNSSLLLKPFSRSNKNSVAAKSSMS